MDDDVCDISVNKYFTRGKLTIWFAVAPLTEQPIQR
jgi:hypothetical protein